MTVPASQIFDYLETRSQGEMLTHVVHCEPFSVLRRCLRSIVTSIQEAESLEATEVSTTLRALLSEWLTVPVAFDEQTLGAIRDLGSGNEVEARWGRSIREAYEKALSTIPLLTSKENPARTTLRGLLEKTIAGGAPFKIYCSRRAIPHFLSLETERVRLDPEHFLYSGSRYRQVAPFKVLLKMGPLRSRGWGAAPDALVTAPRFDILVKVVWAGCEDEPDFGYDPVLFSDGDVRPLQPSLRPDQPTSRGVVWRKTTVLSETEGRSEVHSGDEDDLAVLGNRNPVSEARRATLVQIDGDHGILYPPLSKVLSLDPGPEAEPPVAARLPGETLTEGMFLVLHTVSDVSMGAPHAEEGKYSRLWKERLRAELMRNRAGLLVRLRKAGINLLGLGSRVEHWCKPADTVIPAPLQRKHFQVLMEVIGMESLGSKDGKGTPAGWEYAWGEIARSRGEASQTGRLEQESIEEDVARLLNEDCAEEVAKGARLGKPFTIQLPAEAGTRGTVRFHPILLVEEGYLAPANQLKLILELGTVELWRV